MLGEEVGPGLDSHSDERRSHEPPNSTQKAVALALLGPPQSTVESYLRRRLPTLNYVLA